MQSYHRELILLHLTTKQICKCNAYQVACILWWPRQTAWLFGTGIHTMTCLCIIQSPFWHGMMQTLSEKLSTSYGNVVYCKGMPQQPNCHVVFKLPTQLRLLPTCWDSPKKFFFYSSSFFCLCFMCLCWLWHSFWWSIVCMCVFVLFMWMKMLSHFFLFKPIMYTSENYT